ncbi:hypothetical protein BOTBODRAFT_518886 [Botryobasidium botryosum FD-172 SS1]|uniref:TERF2-interacting telomeric protein 1 Myb domain-containing protein n=1 Tax=Botryobasidium botryosum (strain FD-172 SS1) TaxID=930990 RepID=A0A067N4K1_BOTB1|nr:hypothetical protein BOTBODRAFT_518886 [Botryobasidium botryosum FD-172 SS1]
MVRTVSKRARAQSTGSDSSIVELNAASGSRVASSKRATGELFVTDNSVALEFHIQKTLDERLKRFLEHQIERHGGTVANSTAIPPSNGYILIDPDTEKGERLKTRFPDNGKNRYVVCWTFVLGSIQAGRLLTQDEMSSAKPIFVRNGRPINIYLHSTLGKARIKSLSSRISINGGLVKTQDGITTKEEDAVILVNPDSHSKLRNELTILYDHRPNQYVEHYNWVDESIHSKKCTHTLPLPKRLGGRKMGSTTAVYTVEEDDHLVEYIAKRIPQKAAGGRSGQNLYKELVDRPEDYPWACRHSWSSWANRYKRNMEKFDKRIEKYLERHPQEPGAKGQYNHVREEVLPSRIRSRVEGGSDVEDDDAAASEEAAGQKRKRSAKRRHASVISDSDGQEMALVTDPPRTQHASSSRQNKRQRGSSTSPDIDLPAPTNNKGKQKAVDSDTEEEEPEGDYRDRPRDDEENPFQDGDLVNNEDYQIESAR